MKIILKGSHVTNITSLQWRF